MWDLGFDRRFKIGKGPSSRENHMEMANEGKGERVAGGWGVRGEGGHDRACLVR